MLALHFPDGSQLSVNVGDTHVVGRGQHGLDDLYVSQSQFAVSCASQDGTCGLRVSALGANRASSLVISNPLAESSIPSIELKLACSSCGGGVPEPGGRDLASNSPT